MPSEPSAALPSEPSAALPSKPSAARPILTACVLAALTVLAYSLNLRATALSAEERIFAEQARAPRTSLDVFVHVADENWLQPAAVYAPVIVRRLGGGDYSGRMASIAIGALNVALVYGAVRLLAPEWVAIASALLLLATPAHAWFARLGTDAIYPVPFVLVWMIAMLRFVQFDNPRALMAAAAALGVGIYTHPAAPLTMGWLWIATLIGLVAWRRVAIRNLAALVIGLLVPLIPAAYWFARHPATYNDTFGRWAVFAAHMRFPLDGLRAQMNWNTVGNRASIFWGLIDPSFLLFAPEGRTIAPFLLCSAVLGGLGLARLLTTAQSPHRMLLLSALFIPLLIASTFGQPHALAMAATLSAAAALIAGVGVDSLKTRPGYWTWLTVAAVAASIYEIVASK